MKKFVSILLICAITAYGVSARHSYGLTSNRTPKVPSVFSNACDECQLIIRRIAEVAKDPSKLAELKALLSVLCDTTSYKDECRIFVSRIDLFLDKLLPYLHEPHAVCKKLHICSNSRLHHLHKVGMFFAKQYVDQSKIANDLLCEECHFAAHELQTLVEDENYQKQVKEFLSNEVCANLGKMSGSCNLMIDSFLPDFFVELEKILHDDKKFCIELKLCKNSNILTVPIINNDLQETDESSSSADSDNDEDNTRAEVAKKSLKTNGSIHHLLKSIGRLRLYRDSVKVSMSCLECRFGVDSFKFELEKNKTIQSLAHELRKVICAVLPSNALSSCEDFFHLYASTIVLMTIEQIDGKSICSNLHMCKNNEYSTLNLVKHRHDYNEIKCESCKVISQVLISEMAPMRFRDNLVNDVKGYVCTKIPERLYFVCENLVKGYTPIILTKVLQYIDNGDLCRKLHACT